MSLSRKLFSLLFVYSFILIFVYLFISATAFAQTAQPLNLTTNPDVFDLSANPGDTLKETIRVRNNNDASTNLKISIQKITPDKNGQLVVQTFKPQEDYAKWLTITSTVTASSREWTDIPFTITIPKSAAFGYYWAIVISTDAGRGQNGATAHIAGAIAIPVLLAVQKAGTIFDARLLDFRTDSGFYEYLPTQFETTIENKSNVHIKPIGNIFVTDWLNNQVARLSINKDLGSILPGGKRVFTTPWDDSFITVDPKMEDGKILVDKNGKPEMQVNIHFDKLLSLRIGKYTATALVVVSGDKKDISFQQTTTFFVFPWKIILGLIVFILLAGIGLMNITKSIFRGMRKVLKK